MAEKQRLDLKLVELGFCETREKAKALIMSGNVFVKGQREDKAGTSFDENVQIEIKGQQLKYVSRGGLKLEKAFEIWPLPVDGSVCMDVGSSTGGFTDCMLQNGAAHVYAVDVGHDQLHRSLCDAVFSEHTLFDRSGKPEIEAHLFAADLLLRDEDVLSALEENPDLASLASSLDVYPEFLLFKLKSMNSRGYDLPIPAECRNSFWNQ